MQKNKKWYNKSMNKQISMSTLCVELTYVRTKKKSVNSLHGFHIDTRKAWVYHLYVGFYR